MVRVGWRLTGRRSEGVNFRATRGGEDAIDRVGFIWCQMHCALENVEFEDMRVSFIKNCEWMFANSLQGVGAPRGVFARRKRNCIVLIGLKYNRSDIMNILQECKLQYSRKYWPPSASRQV